MFKKIYSIVLIIIGFYSHIAQATESKSDPQKQVQSFILALQEEAKRSSPDFETLLSQYLDWKIIVQKILAAPRRYLRKGAPNQEENKQHFNEFIAQFTEKFKKRMIKTYANASYLDKFNKAHFNFDQMSVESKGKASYEVSINVQLDDNTMLETKWYLSNGKIIDLSIDNIQLFKSPREEMTSIFNNYYNQSQNFKLALGELMAKINEAVQ